MVRQLIALCLVALLPSAATGGTIAATVVSIGDGDSLRVWHAGQVVTVRLACIDAPELNQAPYGQQARDALRRRLRTSSSVNLSIKATDRFGGMVAEVISNASDPVNIGLALVESGQAFVYLRYLGQCNARAYLAALAASPARGSSAVVGMEAAQAGATAAWMAMMTARPANRCAEGHGPAPWRSACNGGWLRCSRRRRSRRRQPQAHRSAPAIRGAPPRR